MFELIDAEKAEKLEILRRLSAATSALVSIQRAIGVLHKEIAEMHDALEFPKDVSQPPFPGKSVDPAKPRYPLA